LLGDDVGEVGVEGPPKLDWLCEGASEADDKAASIDPDVDRERPPAEGASGRDCECACGARKAFASSASNSSGGQPFVFDIRFASRRGWALGFWKEQIETYASRH